MSPPLPRCSSFEIQLGSSFSAIPESHLPALPLLSVLTGDAAPQETREHTPDSPNLFQPISSTSYRQTVAAVSGLSFRSVSLQK